MKKSIFETVEYNAPRSSVFDLSHDVKYSMSMGQVIPIYNMECLPSDYVSINCQNFFRLAPLVSPVMHKIKAKMHFFFVPNRIIWDKWEDWIIGNKTGKGENIDLDVVEHPYYEISEIPYPLAYQGVAESTIADYLGIPTIEFTAADDQIFRPRVNALPFGAFWKIYQEYYADQNNSDIDYLDYFAIITEGNNNSQDINGNIDFAGYIKNFLSFCPPKAWEHDYFTSALPFAQKGEAVFLPIEDVPVESPYVNGIGLPRKTIQARNVDTNGLVSGPLSSVAGTINISGIEIFPSGQVAKLSDSQFATINNLRRAFRLQEWLEKNARGGTRYNEAVRVHFAQNTGDARINRPEYLGGLTQHVVISEVLSTAETVQTDEVTNPVGQMAGHGISVGSGNVVNYKVKEHGWIMGMLHVMPDTAYSQGIHRKFLRFDKFDYAWPEFAHIGEQEILNQELFVDTRMNEDFNNSTWGYVPRYSEYKFENNRVAGEMRSTLDYWHMGRKFDTLPLLGQDFIYPQYPLIDRTDPDDPTATPNNEPWNRIFAVTKGYDHLYCHTLFGVKANRPLPYFGTPSI